MLDEGRVSVRQLRARLQTRHQRPVASDWCAALAANSQSNLVLIRLHQLITIIQISSVWPLSISVVYGPISSHKQLNL